LTPDMADLPFGKRSSAGKLFAGSGGVMEAAIRTAHYRLTGKEMANPTIQELRGLEGIKEASIQFGDVKLGVAVANGVANARQLLDQIKAGRNDLHFIEVMTCPGGCIGGGGQPFHTDPQKIKMRLQALYQIDQNDTLRCSHQNRAVQSLYEEFLEEPLSEKSHELLHTHYSKREVLL
jgi:iron only hydrogenase large subunit-like protein